jgi:hypothetical protein
MRPYHWRRGMARRRLRNHWTEAMAHRTHRNHWIAATAPRMHPFHWIAATAPRTHPFRLIAATAPRMHPYHWGSQKARRKHPCHWMAMACRMLQSLAAPQSRRLLVETHLSQRRRTLHSCYLKREPGLTSCPAHRASPYRKPAEVARARADELAGLRQKNRRNQPRSPLAEMPAAGRAAPARSLEASVHSQEQWQLAAPAVLMGRQACPNTSACQGTCAGGRRKHEHRSRGARVGEGVRATQAWCTARALLT